MAAKSAIPLFYYTLFGVLEPALALAIFVGIVVDPKNVHDSQGPWHADPPSRLPTATLITVLQLSYITAVLGLINVFILHVARRSLSAHLPLQEKVVHAILLPLTFGDVAHFVLTTYALKAEGWAVEDWPLQVWAGFAIGFALFVARLAWFCGIGRYVHSDSGSTGYVKSK